MLTDFKNSYKGNRAINL